MHYLIISKTLNDCEKVIPVADVPRHRIFVKVCLVIIHQFFVVEIFDKVCLVDGVLFGDRDHPGRVARHVPNTNVASP